MTETIKKMLQDPDSCNDELNARIWCWKGGKGFVSANKAFFVGFQYSDDGETYKDAPQVWAKDYTTSLDAAMSIGKDELEGWRLSIAHHLHTDWQIHMTNGETTVAKYSLPDMPRAICFARISALEYVRGQ